MYHIINENNSYGGSFSIEPVNCNYTEIEPNLATDIWNGSDWLDGRTDEEIRKSLVPKEVANMNFRLSLIYFRIFPSIIDTAFSYMPDNEEKEEYLALWNFANTMERNNPKLIEMAQEFGINATRLDEIFKYANTL